MALVIYCWLTLLTKTYKGIVKVKKTKENKNRFFLYLRTCSRMSTLINSTKLNSDWNDVSDVKCRFPSTLRHMLFSHFVVTLKDLSFHFGVQMKMNEERLNNKSMLNDQWAQSECFVSERWTLCEQWTQTEQSGKHKWTQWAQVERTKMGKYYNVPGITGWEK